MGDLVSIPDRGINYNQTVKSAQKRRIPRSETPALVRSGTLIPFTGTPELALPGLRTVSLDEVAPEVTEWLWFPYFPLGELTLIQGNPGVGKKSAFTRRSNAGGDGVALAGAD